MWTVAVGEWSDTTDRSDRPEVRPWSEAARWLSQRSLVEADS